MIAPQVPARGSVGQAIFDHQAYCHLDHPMGVVTTGRRQIAQIDVKVLTALRAGVRRVGHQKINRTSGGQIAQGVYGALPACVAIGQMVTSWAGGVLMVTAVRHQLRPWEILDVDNALRRVWNKAPCGRTFKYEACYQGPDRCAVDSYLPRLISSPSS